MACTPIIAASASMPMFRTSASRNARSARYFRCALVTGCCHHSCTCTLSSINHALYKFELLLKYGYLNLQPLKLAGSRSVLSLGGCLFSFRQSLECLSAFQAKFALRLDKLYYVPRLLIGKLQLQEFGLLRKHLSLLAKLLNLLLHLSHNVRSRYSLLRKQGVYVLYAHCLQQVLRCKPLVSHRAEVRYSLLCRQSEADTLSLRGNCRVSNSGHKRTGLAKQNAYTFLWMIGSIHPS